MVAWSRAMFVKDIFGRPASRRRLMICIGPCCNANGAASLLLEQLRAKLSDAMTYGDMIGEASCVRRSCLGKCTGEPLAYVYPDGVWRHKPSVEDLLLILREQIIDERPIQKPVFNNDF